MARNHDKLPVPNNGLFGFCRILKIKQLSVLGLELMCFLSNIHSRTKPSLLSFAHTCHVQRWPTPTGDR